MLSVKINGLGHCFPQQRVSSEDLDRRLGLAEGTVLKKSGLKYRYFASEDETASALGAIAAKRALAKANLEIHQIDAIIAASGVGEQPIPCMAALIQWQLGLGNSGIPCFDINSTCLSFISALEMAAYLIHGGRFQQILIVSSELPSRGLHWQDLDTCTIFGDGAAACVLGPSDGSSKIIACEMETHSSGANLCRFDVGGSRFPGLPDKQYDESHYYFRMQSKPVFKQASVILTSVLDKLLTRSALSLDDLDWVVPHQASQLALMHARKMLGLPADRFVNMYENIGNQMAASIPTILSLMQQENQLQRGQHIMLLGTGAGLAAAGIVLVF